MIRHFLAAVVAAAVSLPARADDPLPPAVLDDLKAATVFVKATYGSVALTGSGFVFKIEKNDALIVTNDHVVNRLRNNQLKREYSVVFHSGRESKEKVVPAELVAADAERDLAILRVRGVKDFAKAIDLSKKAEIRETMAVYTIGFPLGEALATSRRNNPAVTVSKGTVSSIREDDKGDTFRVQIDGELNPGNSGGPVVDAKGQLVGVAVARIKGTRMGLAIPPTDVTDLLDGRFGSLVTKVVKTEDGVAEINVEMKFIDPLGKVSKAAIRVAPMSGLGQTPRSADDKRKPLPDAEVFALTVDPKAQQATGTIKVKRAGDRPLVEYWCQPVYTNGARADIVASPVVVRVHFGLAAASAQRPPRVPFPGGPPGTLPEEPGPLPGTRPGGLFAKPDSSGKASLTPGKPGASGERIGIADLKVSGLTGKKVTIGSGGSPACLTWATGGKSFYHLTDAGVVRRVNYPDFTEAAALDVGSKCSWLCLSAEGVVITASGHQEMWLVHPETLAVRSRVPIAKAYRVVSAPASSFAYAFEEELTGGTLSVIDLKAGKRIRQYQKLDLSDRVHAPFGRAAMTPDGKSIFAEGFFGAGRYAVSGDSVKLEDSTEMLGGGVRGEFVISPDGEFIWVCAAGPNNAASMVYPVKDLKRPALALRATSTNAVVFGFDLKASLVYGASWGSQLIVMDGEGAKLKEFSFLAPGQQLGPQSKQFLVHPEGKKLLILCQDAFGGGKPSEIYSVTIP